VKAHTDHSATLEPVGQEGNDGAGTPGQPLVLPDPLGETPLIVEVMSEV
jgi:hypothetical protein